METTCPHCSQGIEIDPETLESLRGTSHFDCPTCSGLVPVPQAAVLPSTLPNPQVRAPRATVAPAQKQTVITSVLRTYRGLNRNVVILGTVTLLTLGGLAIFIAARKGGKTTNTKTNVTSEAINNKYFTDLIASGATTGANLQLVTNIQPMGVTYLGVSREKLTWEQAQALAKRTASQVLTIEPAGQASRRPVLDAVAGAYPELLGKTTWVMEAGEPRVLDGADVNSVTTLSRPRTALFNWYPVQTDKDRAWVRVTKITPLPRKLYKLREWVKAGVEYNNPGPGEVLIFAMPRAAGKDAENYGNRGLKLGKGMGAAEPEFTCTGPARVEEILITMMVAETEAILATTRVPFDAVWEPDPNIIDVEIISVRPPATLSTTKEITIPATAGEKFTLGVTARYKAPDLTKLASNLLLKEAEILPPEFIQELTANHATTWHFDTESRPGYAAVSGEGEISFDLIGYAPRQAGAHTFKTNLGLFDKQSWATKVLKFYPTTIVATDPVPAANPLAR